MKSGVRDLFERPASGTRALLVHVGVRGEDGERAVEEFAELARATGAQAVGMEALSPRRPDPRYFVGAGKAEELRERAAAEEAELVIFDHGLTPAQERNLEALLQCRVLDRIGLILDIFAQRATTFEGKLQVELAQLRHLSTRLVRGWTHLERQKGGIGLRGPGETQLETDRRLVGKRIERIRRDLDAVRRRREVNRRGRQRSGVPVVALVGYTNAGKSTLFNRLTGARVRVADQLFATLDPTLRRVRLPAGVAPVLVDTVGFVGDLPHELVAAFRATLEETRRADLLLHVVDAGAPDRRERVERVNEVLAEIGAGELPQIEVMNKTDRLSGPSAPAPGAERCGAAVGAGAEAEAGMGAEAGAGAGAVRRVWLSARTGSGIEDLLAVLGERFEPFGRSREVRLGPGGARMRARLYELGAVLEERPCDDGGSVLRVCIPEADLVRLEAAARRSSPSAGPLAHAPPRARPAK